MTAAEARPPSDRPTDWPDEGPIDLDRHDLPHDSSQTEWWYVNGHALVPGGRRVSLFAAFFQAVIGQDEQTGAPEYGHSLTWAISDWARDRYVTESLVDARASEIGLQRIDRGEGSADARLNRAFREVFAKGKVPRPDRVLQRDVFVGARRLELDYDGNTFRKTDDGAYEVELVSEDGRAGATLRFTPRCPPIRHGQDGVVKSPDGMDMFYYFMPTCALEGEVRLDGQTLPLEQGRGWYDHEFGRHPSPSGPAPEPAAPQPERRDVAWNWVAITLDDGRALTAYELVDSADGARMDARAILVTPGGERLERAPIELEPTRWWRSTRTFNDFPVAWSLRVPSLDLEVELEAAFDDQEFVALISKTTFWEGACAARGTLGGQPVEGLAYIERSGFLTVDTLDDFFAAVGKEVRKSVDGVLPLEPDAETRRDLIAAPGQEHLLEGVDFGVFVGHVVEPIRSIVDRGGKSWRSYAALACCDIVGGDSREYVRWLALPEMIHVGSMIVDDVQDESTVRRGGPPVHLVYGQATAINAGTAAYFLSQKLLRGEGLSRRDQLRLYDEYFLALRAGHGGQALDIAGFDAAVERAVASGDSGELEAAILAANRLKTAVPAACLARMGAIAGGGTEVQIAGLGGFFEALGLAFQVVDDLLNLRGFQGDLKNRGEDLTAGKVTLPVAKAFGRLARADRERLLATLKSRPTDPAVIGEVIELLEACGALSACDEQARALVERAWERLDAVVEDSMPKIMLRAFGWYVLDRHY